MLPREVAPTSRGTYRIGRWMTAWWFAGRVPWNRAAPRCPERTSPVRPIRWRSTSPRGWVRRSVLNSHHEGSKLDAVEARSRGGFGYTNPHVRAAFSGAAGSSRIARVARYQTLHDSTMTPKAAAVTASSWRLLICALRQYSDASLTTQVVVLNK